MEAGYLEEVIARTLMSNRKRDCFGHSCPKIVSDSNIIPILLHQNASRTRSLWFDSEIVRAEGALPIAPSHQRAREFR